MIPTGIEVLKTLPLMFVFGDRCEPEAVGSSIHVQSLVRGLLLASVPWRVEMALESKLIPIMREGIEIIKMILFKQLKVYLSKKYASRQPEYISKLSGAIINDLFGTPNQEEPFALFVRENTSVIEEETAALARNFERMRIPLTDALRIQFLCDHQEGIDSASVLVRAKELGILIVDREVPLPAQFVSLVKKLGGALRILAPCPTDRGDPSESPQTPFHA